MAFPRYVHDPTARLDYGWNWNDPTVGRWLATDETIVTATVTVVNPDGTPYDDTGDDDPIVVEQTSNTDTTVTAWISGGNPKGGVNGVYTVTCHIVTSATREDDRSITLQIKER